MTTKLKPSEGARTLPLYSNLKAWEAMLLQGVLTLVHMYDAFTVHTRLLLQQNLTDLNKLESVLWNELGTSDTWHK
jgi:hypothetical protein